MAASGTFALKRHSRRAVLRALLPAALAACGGSPTAPGTAVAPGVAAALEPAPPQPPAAPTSPAGHPRDDLIPRSVLFGYSERTGVQLSPDGKTMSWLAPANGVLNLWVAPAGKLDQARVLTRETARPIRQYFWAYTSKHVVYVQDSAGDENFHLFRTDVADGTTIDLTPFPGARADLQGASPRHPAKLLVNMNDRDPRVFDVHEVDLVTGKRKLVVQNDGELIRFSHDNDLKVRLASKKLPDGSTQILVRDGTRWKPFETIPFEDAETTRVVAFAPDNRSFYMRDTRGRNTAALVAIDLATKQPKVIAEDARSDAGGVILHPTRRIVQAVAFEYDRARWQAIDGSIAKDLDALARLDGGDFEIASRTLDDRTWLILTTADVNPRRYYLWDRAAQKATFLFSGRPEMDRHPLLRMWPVEIRSRDGLQMVSYLTLPAAADPDRDGKPDAPAPMVLYVHGGPWERDSWGYNPVHQLFGNRGYAVLSVNYRGSTGFGKQFLNAANLQWGRKMHDDLIDAVSWAVQAGVAKPREVCIMGGSYGGYAALAGLALTPDAFKCGVDIVGMSNLHTFIASIPPYWAPFRALLRTRVGDPDTPEGKALLTAASPLTHAARIKRPLLIAQGANDPRVKQAESEQIVAAMKRHGLPVTYALFPDEGHGFERQENTIAFFAIAEAFLSAHLGGYYLPAAPGELEASSMQIKDGRIGIPGLPR